MGGGERGTDAPDTTGERTASLRPAAQVATIRSAPTTTPAVAVAGVGRAELLLAYRKRSDGVHDAQAGERRHVRDDRSRSLNGSTAGDSSFGRNVYEATLTVRSAGLLVGSGLVGSDGCRCGVGCHPRRPPPRPSPVAKETKRHKSKQITSASHDADGLWTGLTDDGMSD